MAPARSRSSALALALLLSLVLARALSPWRPRAGCMTLGKHSVPSIAPEPGQRYGRLMRGRFEGLASAAMLLLALVACKKEGGDTSGASTSSPVAAKAEKEMTAKIEAKLAFLDGLAGALPAPTTKDGAALGKDYYATVWVYEQDLGHLTTEPKDHRLPDTKKLRDCAIEARQPAFGKPSFTKLRECEGLHYAYVVRPKITAPKVVKEPDKEKFQQGEFKSGVIEGDVLVYDLEEKKQLGGFRFHAQSSDGDIERKGLERDLYDNYEREIAAAERKFITHP